ncbi:hypothetical protein B0H14DRAFT_3508163 [Mycena olivaceomarginata]|nr:hypothetical protein B0H14DRAFT_3508163 [Mycena olivaceomarginata]
MLSKFFSPSSESYQPLRQDDSEHSLPDSESAQTKHAGPDYLGKLLLLLACANFLVAFALFTVPQASGARQTLADLPRPDPYVGLNRAARTTLRDKAER